MIPIYIIRIFTAQRAGIRAVIALIRDNKENEPTAIFAANDLWLLGR